MTMTPIPTDEALKRSFSVHGGWTGPSDLTVRGLRAVATLAADEAVKEAVLRIGSRLMGLPSREYCDVMTVLTTDFPSAFDTPPKEPPVQTAANPDAVRRSRRDEFKEHLSPAPKPDEATVRKCIEIIKKHQEDKQGWGRPFPVDETIRALESLLPQPEPPLPTHYWVVDEHGTSRRVDIDTIKRRHGLLTPEQAAGAVCKHFSWAQEEMVTNHPNGLLAALRLAAKGGGEQ